LWCITLSHILKSVFFEKEESKQICSWLRKEVIKAGKMVCGIFIGIFAHETGQ